MKICFLRNYLDKSGRTIHGKTDYFRKFRLIFVSYFESDYTKNILISKNFSKYFLTNQNVMLYCSPSDEDREKPKRGEPVQRFFGFPDLKRISLQKTMQKSLLPAMFRFML